MMTIKQLYQDVFESIKGICDKTYLRSRPKSVEERIGSYIVVSLPYSIRNNEMNDSGAYNDYSTTVQIEIYVRDKASASNPNGFNVNVMNEKVEKVRAVFPISTENVLVISPVITMQDDDGDGFGVTIIQARLRTK